MCRLVHSPHTDNVVEMLELPHAEESILVSVEVVEQQLRLVALQGKLILQHRHCVLFRHSPAHAGLSVLFKYALHLGPGQ